MASTDPDRPLSARRRIAAVLAERIRRGEYLPGQQLPPCRALAREFGETAPTVSHAFRMLVREGLLVTLNGIGTFVPDPTIPGPDLYTPPARPGSGH